MSAGVGGVSVGMSGAGGLQQRSAGQGGVQQPIGGNQSTGFLGNAVGGASTASGMMSGLMGSMMGGSNAQQNRPQHKGIPAVIPTGISPQQQQQPSTSQPNQGPNLMQKLTDMTAPGGDILSKGKELIFMKFGLGGK